MLKLFFKMLNPTIYMLISWLKCWENHNFALKMQLVSCLLRYSKRLSVLVSCMLVYAFRTRTLSVMKIITFMNKLL